MGSINIKIKILLLILGFLATIVSSVVVYKFFTEDFVVKIEKKSSPTPTPIRKLTPTPTPVADSKTGLSPSQSSVKSPIGQTDDNYQFICEALREEFKTSLIAKWDEAIAELYDPNLPFVGEDVRQKMERCIVSCPPIYYRYCIEHHGDLSDFNTTMCPQCLFE